MHGCFAASLGKAVRSESSDRQAVTPSHATGRSPVRPSTPVALTIHSPASAANHPSPVACDFLWTTEIEGQEIGRIALAHTSRHVVRLEQFHIEPQWQHTKVVAGLIHRIHEYCWDHACLKLVALTGSAPAWLLRLLGQSGFRWGREVRVGNTTRHEFYLDLYHRPQPQPSND